MQWTRQRLTCEIEPLKKYVADAENRVRLRAAAASDAPELAAESAAAELTRMSRDSAIVQRAPEPASKPSRGMRGTSRGRHSARKGSVVVLRGPASSTIPRDVLPHMDGVVRLFRSRADTGGKDAVLKLLRVPAAELEEFVNESLPPSPLQLFDLREALQNLESTGSAVSWRFDGIVAGSYEQLWSELHSINCPRLSELPLWTEAALFIGDDSLTGFLAPLIADMSQSGNDDGSQTQSGQAQQRAMSAWQQLWVGDDGDLDSSGKIRVASTASRRSKWSTLSDSDDDLDDWRTPAGRAFDIRLDLLSGHTSRRRKLDMLMSSNRLEDATALVLSSPPTCATHAISGSCSLEIGSARGDISDKELGGYESYSDSESTDDPASDTGFCFPAHEKVFSGSSRTDSPLPPLSVFHTQTFYGDRRLPVLRGSTSPRLRLSPDFDVDADLEDKPTPELYARYPTYAIAWPVQLAPGKSSESQQLMTQIKFLALGLLYSNPFNRDLFDRLNSERTKLLRDIAVADTLRGLRLLSESRLLPLRCVRELKRHLLRCGIAAAETQSLHASLLELDDMNLVVAARYVHFRYFRRFQFLRDIKAEQSALFARMNESSLTYAQSPDAAPVLSLAAARLEAFMRDDKLNVEALGRFIFEEAVPPDQALAAAVDASKDEDGEVLRHAGNRLAALLTLRHSLDKKTREVLSAKLVYDALDLSTIRATGFKPGEFIEPVTAFRVALLELSHEVCVTHLETLTCQSEDRHAKLYEVQRARDSLEETIKKIDLELESCIGPAFDAEIADVVMAAHIEEQIEALSSRSYFESSLAHAQAAMEMLESEIGVAYETLEVAIERCSCQGLHNLDDVVLVPFKRALRKRLIAEASVHAGSVLESLIAEEDSRKTSEEAAKQKKNAKKDKKSRAEIRKREEAAAAAAAAAAQRAEEEREAEEAAQAAEAVRAAERAEQQQRADAEHAAALERRKEQMAAAKKQQDAEKERLRALQRAERDAQLQAQEEADHARAIAASEAEFAKASMLQQQSALPPAREYRPPPSSGATSILPPIATFAGMNLLGPTAVPVPAVPAAVPSSIFDWPPQSLYSVLPPSSILPPLPGSAVPPIAPLQPVAGGDVSGLSNAAGEYNCFLNSLVQALYRLRCFRTHLVKSDLPEGSPPQRDISRDLAVVRSLQDLFLALEGGVRLLRDPLATGGGGGAVAPTALRLALASLAPGGGERNGGCCRGAQQHVRLLPARQLCIPRRDRCFARAGHVRP